MTYPRYDYEAVRLVRRFRGHTDRITDLTLAADARWLLSASLDGTVRVWDVPAAQCLQVRIAFEVVTIAILQTIKCAGSCRLLWLLCNNAMRSWHCPTVFAGAQHSRLTWRISPCSGLIVLAPTACQTMQRLSLPCCYMLGLGIGLPLSQVLECW